MRHAFKKSIATLIAAFSLVTQSASAGQDWRPEISSVVIFGTGTTVGAAAGTLAVAIVVPALVSSTGTILDKKLAGEKLIGLAAIEAAEFLASGEVGPILQAFADVNPRIDVEDVAAGVLELEEQYVP